LTWGSAVDVLAAFLLAGSVVHSDLLMLGLGPVFARGWNFVGGCLWGLCVVGLLLGGFSLSLLITNRIRRKCAAQAARVIALAGVAVLYLFLGVLLSSLGDSIARRLYPPPASSWTPPTRPIPPTFQAFRKKVAARLPYASLDLTVETYATTFGSDGMTGIEVVSLPYLQADWMNEAVLARLGGKRPILTDLTVTEPR
jgi:hypothetical protein